MRIPCACDSQMECAAIRISLELHERAALISNEGLFVETGGLGCSRSFLLQGFVLIHLDLFMTSDESTLDKSTGVAIATHLSHAN